MVSREGLQKCALGDYCELIVGAAFIAAGAEVAFPFGNQYRWDLIVKEKPEDRWLSVQVKTVKNVHHGENPTLHVHRQDKDDTPYTEKDIDLLVAVHPESGTLWKVPIAVFSGTKYIRLQDEYLWNGSVRREAIPSSLKKSQIVIKRLKTMLSETHARQAVEREAIRAALPPAQPDHVAKDTWDMVTRWCAGEGYKRIAGSYDLGQAGVRQRVIRGLKRIGVKDLPESFMKSLDPSYRRKMDRTEAAPRYNPPDPAQGTLLP